jgi:hypothetical protein
MRLPLGSVYDILWHGRVDFTGKFDKMDDLSVFSRVLPCGFSDVGNCCETSNRFMAVENRRIFKMFICVKPSLRVFVADRRASTLTQMPSPILLCGLNYAIGVGDLQNRTCSDIAVTSKVEILDTSFVASPPARSGHWE